MGSPGRPKLDSGDKIDVRLDRDVIDWLVSYCVQVRDSTQTHSQRLRRLILEFQRLKVENNELKETNVELDRGRETWRKMYYEEVLYPRWAENGDPAKTQWREEATGKILARTP